MPFRYTCVEHPGWEGEVLQDAAAHRDAEHRGLRDPVLISGPLRSEFYPRLPRCPVCDGVVRYDGRERFCASDPAHYRMRSPG